LNASKLEKMFSKPFLKAMDSHSDGINCMAKNNQGGVISGAADGEIIEWDLNTKSHKIKLQAHTGGVRGLTYSNPSVNNITDTLFLSTGDDRKICIWSQNLLKR
jgi:WD repeat and SOF domain-containing protein 1